MQETHRQKLRDDVWKQLQYIRRDIWLIVDIIQENRLKISKKVADLLNTITTLYEQQLHMYDQRVHNVPDRIVSITQPWVRPIVRGKAHANTEFGAKLHISMVDGYLETQTRARMVQTQTVMCARIIFMKADGRSIWQILISQRKLSSIRYRCLRHKIEQLI